MIADVVDERGRVLLRVFFVYRSGDAAPVAFAEHLDAPSAVSGGGHLRLPLGCGIVWVFSFYAWKDSLVLRRLRLGITVLVALVVGLWVDGTMKVKVEVLRV